MTRRKLPPKPAVKDSDYEVGYGKPPRETRFRPGQSGNPNGRPKGSRNRIPDIKEERLKTIILEEAYRDIAVREGDRTITVPVIRAVVRTLANKGLKGETRALNRVLELVAPIEDERHQSWREYFQTMVEYKTEWEEELERRRRHGITGLREPLLHPDDVMIDPRTGDVKITGPMTREEAEIWERGRQEVVELAFVIEALESRLSKHPDDQSTREIYRDLKRRYDRYVSVLGPPQKRLIDESGGD